VLHDKTTGKSAYLSYSSLYFSKNIRRTSPLSTPSPLPQKPYPTSDSVSDSRKRSLFNPRLNKNS
jgi:hypothetical protein